MRVLVINEYIEGSGAEQIAKDQIDVLEGQNFDVFHLGFAYKNGQVNNPNWEDEKHIIISSHIFFKIFFDVFFYIKIRNTINKIHPDLILLHNVFSSPVAVYYACRGYKTIQIVHDFKILCPTSMGVLLNNQYKICMGYKCNNCIKLCTNGFKEMAVMLLRKIQLKEILYFRKKYVQKLLCPSSWLTAITKKYGFNSFTLNNLTTIQPCSSLYARKTIELNFVAAGGLVLNKGVVFFAEKIVKYPNVTLTIFGNGGTENDQIKIQHLSLLSGNRIQYKGLLEHEKLLKQFSIFSFLIVPSLWMENYPTIVIEGMINKICVIASDRGGARELLADGRGILFSWDDESSIENVIERISNIDVNEYNHIVKKAYDYVCENNNPAIYYDRLISLIN